MHRSFPAASLFVVALAVSLAGCPGSSRSHASGSDGPPQNAKAPPSGASPAAPTGPTAQTGFGSHPSSSFDEAWVFRANAKDPVQQSILGQLVLDTSLRATVRYAALRRLEEQVLPVAIGLAKKIALDPTNTPDANFLRENSIALLVREQKSPDAKSALEQVRASSPDAAILVGRLALAGGN